ncbi:MAG: site-specific integrase [Candidatus Ozemobacteraceae bacterium]
MQPPACGKCFTSSMAAGFRENHLTPVMKLAGLSDRTQEEYVKAVAQLAKFYKRPPAELVEEEVRNFFLELVEQRNVSPSTLKVYKCGIRFFYERTLNKAFHFMGTLRSKREAKLPTVLSVEEVRLILSKVYKPQARMCLEVIFSVVSLIHQTLTS